MNQATELIESLLAEPVENDVDGRALFADEQHAFSAGDVIGDEVGDSLGFAGARRPLNDVTGAGPGAGDGGRLGGIAGYDQVLVSQIERRRRFLLRLRV